jgi:hypothetical protein
MRLIKTKMNYTQRVINSTIVSYEKSTNQKAQNFFYTLHSIVYCSFFCAM